MKNLTIMLLAVVVLVLAVPALADIPQLINFQGVLTDGSGTPIANQTRSVEFRIWNAAVGGASKWSETQNVTTNSQGGFNVLLGSVSPIVDSVFWQPTRWLGIKVETDPEISPRAQIVSVAYSYRVGSINGALGGSIVGDLNLYGTSSTPGNITRSGNPLLSTLDFGNTYVGEAGNSASSGSNSNNTAIGNLALRDISAGGNANSAGGSFALENNTTGLNNTAFGAFALRTNISGANNTAIGQNALANNTGGYNTAVGSEALRLNTIGSGNTACGRQVLYSNINGELNTAIGNHALGSNTTGYRNTASGYGALRENIDGFRNTAIGTFSLSNNTSGWDNTATGTSSLESNNTGYFNTATGYFALRENTIGYRNTANGAYALASNIDGLHNTANGNHALFSNSTGAGNTASGHSALFSNTTGLNNTAIGNYADVSAGNLSNATAIGSAAVVNASNKIRLGNSSVTVIEGQVNFTASSDRNQKENFRPVDGKEVLNEIRGFELTSWNFKGHDPKKFRHYGPMAQDFYAAFGNDAVGQCGDSTTINSGDMSGILMIAVQSLSKENEQFKSENADLKARVEKLEKLFSQNGGVEVAGK
jgi:hypothetical protein